jgi:hypothetical protein
MIERLKIEKAQLKVLNDSLSAELGASKALKEKLLLENKTQKDTN